MTHKTVSNNNREKKVISVANKNKAGNLSPDKFTAFIGGAHFDRMGKLSGQVVQGASNPGVFKSMPGGAGLNTARVVAKLGAKAVICGPVGDDIEADELRKLLKDEHISDGLITMKGRQTGSYVSIIAPDGELIIAMNDLSLNEEMSALWVMENCAEHLAGAKHWFLTANLSRGAVRELVEAADVPIIAATVSQAKAIRFRGVLDKIALMFSNVKEAQSLLGRSDGEGEELAQVLLKRGVKSGVITNGAAAVTYWSQGTVHQIEVPQVSNVVDVTGAGDAMAGAVIAGLDRGLGFGEAVGAGIKAAGETIQVDTPVFKDLSWKVCGG